MPFNLYHEKYMAGFVGAVLGVFFENLLPLFICALIFEVVDFITGVWKSSVEAHRQKKHFAFESVKAWRTVYKVVFIMTGIVLAEMLDVTISESRLRLANMFTAFTCGIEFWSFLENAAIISDHPVFRWLSKYMKRKVNAELGVMEEIQKEDNNG